jgi:flagellar basal body rod protein FlgG
VIVNTATERALDLISSRAADVYNAFRPGAIPVHGDVETGANASSGTIDTMSVTAPNDDYFVTTDARGRTSYTRDGRFTIENGTVVASNGRPVLGFTSQGGVPSELKIDSVDLTLERPQNLRIEPDGSVVYDRRAVDPRSGSSRFERVSIGRLALARFPAATKLSPAGDSTVTAAPGIIPHLGWPCDKNFGGVTPLRREESRIDLNRSLDRLHDAYIAFDALQAAHKAQGHTGKVAMDLLK